MLLAIPHSDACVTNAKTSGKPDLQIFKKSSRKPAQAFTPFAQGHANPSLETQLANLLLSKKGKIVLSLPAVIQRSDYHPFGDGQSNAKMTFGPRWEKKVFPVVGIQTTTKGHTVREYRFDPALNVRHYSETQLNTKWIKVTPDGSNESYYFNFETATMPVAKFLEGIPAAIRTFSGNRVAPDIAKIGKGSGVERFAKDLGAGYNRDGWPDTNVHGLFPNKEGEKTAVGGVVTWGIVDKQFGPFKNLYTCFQPRSLEQETNAGVPSGAGWHHIGNAGETILNNLESAPLPVAIARTHGFPDAALGLAEGITATWIQSDEVLVTVRDEFHWYVNPYEAPVCTEIWVHNCVPNLSNNWGFNCPWP